MTDTAPATPATDVPNPLHFADNEIAQAVLERVQAHPNFFQRGVSDPDAGDAGTDGSTNEVSVASAASADETSAPDPRSTGEGSGVDAPPAVEPSTDQPTTPTTYTVQIDGQPVVLTQTQIDGLLGLNAWAEKLDDSVRDQFNHIEQGRAVAVPTDEFAAYRAWRLQQDRENVAGRGVPAWVDELDPEARAAFERQQTEIAQLRQQVTQTQAEPLAAQHNAETERIGNIYVQAMADYSTSTGLDDAQVGGLLDLAVRAGIIPTLVESQRQYSPSGVLVKDADFALVAKQAMDFGRLQNPHLTPSAPTIPAPTPAAAPATAPVAPHVDPVVAKRARAATLSAAPSAATPLSEIDPRTRTIPQQTAAIAEFLRAQGIAS